jgi:hypothetical protein
MSQLHLPGPFSSRTWRNSFFERWHLAALFLLALAASNVSAQLTANTPMKQIQFIISTGGDDLRGDSEATAEIFSVNGQPLQKIELKTQNDSSWDNNSKHTVLTELSQQLSANQIGEIAISLIQHPGFLETDDNWNIQAVSVNLVSSFGDGSFPLINNQHGFPLVRLTGSQPTVTIGTTAGDVSPKYQIYGLIYTIPGCTSSTIYKCPTTGSLDYGSQSALGTQVSLSSSYGGSLSATVGSSGGQSSGGSSGSGSSGTSGSGSGGGGGASGSLSFASSSSEGSSVTITKTQTSDVKLSGNADGLSHDQDYFIVLLNPLISVNASQLQGSAASTVIGWIPNYAPPSPEVVYLSVAELKNPSTMDPAKLTELQRLGFTSADYQEILQQDPLASSAPYLDPLRYTATTNSFPYGPPDLNSSDCNGGVCTCPNTQQSVSNSVQDQGITSDSTSLSVSAKVPVLKYLTLGGSFTWTNSSTTTNIQSGSQTATVLIACPSPSYTSPLINVDVYWDSIYGSFVFVLDELGNLPGISSGILTDPQGIPQAGVLVELKAGDKTYKTVTNRLGQYNFHAVSAAIAAKLPATGQITARGVTQSVALRAATSTRLQIPTASSASTRVSSVNR